MEEAVGYTRVSTEEHSGGGLSLAAQERSIRAYATMHKFNLVRIFREEGISGGVALSKRPQGRILVQAMEKRNGPRNVIAVKLDRVFRNASDALNQANAWDKNERALHFTEIGGNALDTSSAMGQMFFTMAAAFAEMEKNIAGDRVRVALRHLRDSGKVYTRVTPLGFNRSDDRLVVNTKEMAIVKTIQRLRLSGMSFNRIANQLNSTGVPTKTGATWYPVTIQKVVANKIYGKAA